MLPKPPQAGGGRGLQRVNRAGQGQKMPGPKGRLVRPFQPVGRGARAASSHHSSVLSRAYSIRAKGSTDGATC